VREALAHRLRKEDLYQGLSSIICRTTLAAKTLRHKQQMTVPNKEANKSTDKDSLFFSCEICLNQGKGLIGRGKNLLEMLIMKVESCDALLVVDVQKDFCPGGSLPVEDGHEVVPVINALLYKFSFIVFTRDWHPPDHCSFGDPPKFEDGSWPAHCVQGSEGSEFCEELNVGETPIIFDKGVDPNMEEYGAFGRPDLGDLLREKGITRIFVTGLATNYCVKNTALGAVKQGFQVALVADACRGIDIPPGAVNETLDELREAGVVICSSTEVE